MKTNLLNKKQILEYQQNKPPYLMIDEVEKLIEGDTYGRVSR